VSVYEMHRAWRYGMNYYMHAELPEWSAERPTDYVVTSEAGLRDLQAKGLRLEPRQVSKRAMIVRRPVPLPNY